MGLSLYKAPDISNWDTKNIWGKKGVFGECISLSNLPDISRWDLDSEYDDDIFYFNMINYVEKYEYPLDLMIKESKMSKTEIQKIFELIESEYNLTMFFTEINIKYEIVKCKGDMNAIRDFIENNI